MNNNVEELAAAQETLGIHFNNPSLLRQALIHGSFSNENPALASVPNERLEFLGDAVLGLVVATRLYLDFPHFSEGLGRLLADRDILIFESSDEVLGAKLFSTETSPEA